VITSTLVHPKTRKMKKMRVWKRFTFVLSVISIIVLFCVNWFKFDDNSHSILHKLKEVSSRNLKTNQLFERRLEKESTNLLQDDSEYMHKVDRPEGFETLCKIDPSCPEGCDACCQLPYHNKTGKLVVHHFDAENWHLWNPHMRFENLNSLKKDDLIIYVGANTDGADGVELMRKCPNCIIHIFEPVPTFNKILTEKWDGHKKTNGWDATINKFGLGLNDRIVQLSKDKIIGQSTFGMKETEGDEFEELQIVDASKAVNKVLRNLNNKNEVDLLHVNCEGCEWEMFENLISTGIHRKIRMVQFGSHYFSEVEGITDRYCQIRKTLERTHKMVYGEAWGWERWDRRNNEQWNVHKFLLVHRNDDQWKR